VVVGRGLLAVKPWGECDAGEIGEFGEEDADEQSKEICKEKLSLVSKEEFTTEMKDDCASGRHSFQMLWEKPCYWSIWKPLEIHMICPALPLGRIAR
jgi:hypothetical protein